MLVPQKNMANLAQFDNNHTNVRISQQPGGNSSFSLGWSQPQQNNRYNNPPVNVYKQELPLDEYFNVPNKLLFKENSYNKPEPSSSPYYTDPYPRPYLFYYNREKETHEERYRNLVQESLSHYQDILKETPMKTMISPIETAYMRFAGKELKQPYLREPDRSFYSFNKPQLQITSKQEEFTKITSQPQQISQQTETQFKPKEIKSSPFQMNYQNIMNDFNVPKPKTQPSSNEPGYMDSRPSDMKTGKKIFQPPGGKSSINFW